MELTLDGITRLIEAHGVDRTIASYSNDGGSVRLTMKLHRVKTDESISGIPGWLCPIHKVHEDVVGREQATHEFDGSRLENAISTYNRAVWAINHAAKNPANK